MADAIDPFPDLGSVYKVSGRCQVNRDVADIKLASSVDGRESKNRVAANSGLHKDSTSNVWGHPNLIQKLKMQTTSNVRPTVDGSCLSSRRHGSASTQQGAGTCPVQAGFTLPNSSENRVDEYDNNDPDVVYDNDDLDDYDFDFDEDEKSHEARKKSKWFNAFFERLEKLTVEEIISPAQQWHCPACQGGPGAIDWYRGVQPLMTHSMTKMTRRAKMHRVFAELLVEEMRRRGTFIKPANDAVGKWEGLNVRVADHEIVWPPMVIIMNTKYEQDETGKWSGMGNQELLNYFSSYAAIKARHSYGPQGHRGMSVLIFESSAAGYLEAVRLHKHFKEQGRDRDAWDHSRVPFCPGGKRQLYGYIAIKEDLDVFNRHSQGNSKLKFELRSYQEMVESQIKKINDNSQQLTRLKKKVAQEQQHSQVLAESLGRLSEKLHQTIEPKNRIVRQQAILQHEQNKEEVAFFNFIAAISVFYSYISLPHCNAMVFQLIAKEQYFKEKINTIYQSIDSKEDNFEKLQRAASERVKQSNMNPIDDKDECSAIELHEKNIGEFNAEREKLMKSRQDRRLAITLRYWEDLVKLEEGFEKEFTLLMEKYTHRILH
ncbi:hypothetical protein Gohar_009858 [Gossypium harknessii]|uniref:XS domain-containing protein n=1 Tax=Gossypium harknessii TaxID=34285 RepID=A0A7J9GP28_9ROSI|nr:hypothetical protein [Gossypium harknessii]